MKAWADEQAHEIPHMSYNTLRRGRPPQERLARDLHCQAGVPEGACGSDELAAFQRALPDYQIKVLTLRRPHMITFAGEDVESGKRILILDKEHYDGCTSYGAFLNKSYFCHECNRG